MKHNILFPTFLFCFCFICQRVHAQLEVEYNNNVKIEKSMSLCTDRDPFTVLNLEQISDDVYHTWYGIQAHMKTRNTQPTGSIVSIYGFADGSSTTSNYTSITPMIGVYGRASMSSSASNLFSAGVAGVANTNSGIGVYGAISTTDNPFPTNNYVSYAGYFAGGVRVTGTLTAAAVSTTSDSRLKESIRNLNDSATSRIQLLRPVEYKFKQDSVHYTYEKDAAEMKINHYGLLAQEVQEVFPNLVYESKDGYLSINYTELIPVLIQSVQELSSEVAELKAQLNEIQTQKK